MTLEQECIGIAALSAFEACGLIIDNRVLKSCGNCHPSPYRAFKIRIEDWIEAENQGEVTAVFHSHPNGEMYLSAPDRQRQVATNIDWWLSDGKTLHKFRPVPYLIGRKFKHGELDCYSLFRDAYHLAGIDLPDFERSVGWWLRGENLYIKNMAINGFHEVNHADIQPGDVIIRRAFSKSDPCHAMIWLGDNEVLHHENNGRLSRREKMRRDWLGLIHSIWRHNEWSTLNLAAIYADISAKSR